MKKLIYKYLTLTMMSIIALGCSSNDNENINDTDNLKLYRDVNKLINFSKIHSEGLKHNILALKKELKSEKNKHRLTSKKEITLFFEEQTKEFLNKNVIEYNNKLIPFNAEQVVKFNRSYKLEKVSSNYINKTSGETEVFANIYYNKIENAFGNNSYDIVITNLNKVYQDFLSEETSIPQDEKISIEIMIGVAFDSAEYWNNYENNRISSKNSHKFSFNWSVALADVKGAIGGGLWGSAVAGPLGGAVMGVNMAIIDSSVAHAISQL